MNSETRRLIDSWRRWGWGRTSDLRSDATARAKCACADELEAVLLAASPAPGVVDAAREVDTIVQQTGHAHDWFPALAKLHQALAASRALQPTIDNRLLLETLIDRGAITQHTYTHLCVFIGWLSGDIPELHNVEVPLLAESLNRYLCKLEEETREVCTKV